MNHLRQLAELAFILSFGLASTACGGSHSSAQSATGGKAERIANVQETIAKFKDKSPTIAGLFGKSAGYFVVPTVAEGAFIVGGGHGKGEAFEGGNYVGTVAVSEVSVGAQVGGESYSELVFFESPQDFARLKEGTFKFDAEVTAIAADEGAAKSATFKHGTIAFVLLKKGLMAAAAVSGQTISFTPAK